MGTDIDPGVYVPEFARQNYVDLARDRASTNGSTVGSEWSALIKGWRTQHETDALSGFDKLADWAETVNPEEYGDATDPAALRRQRAIESETMDPSHGFVMTDEDRREAAVRREALVNNATGAVAAGGGEADGDRADVVTDETVKATAKRKDTTAKRTAVESTPTTNR